MRLILAGILFGLFWTMKMQVVRSPETSGHVQGARNYVYTKEDYNYNCAVRGSLSGARGDVVFKALCYKPACRGFETR
jgi:hypothetical protein